MIGITVWTLAVFGVAVALAVEGRFGDAVAVAACGLAVLILWKEL